MKQYTGMYIIHPSQTEDQIKVIVAEMSKLFTDLGGVITELQEWGMRDLAYEINYLRKGYFVKFKVDATVEAIAEYNRIANIREDIIRHIIVNE